MPIPPSPPRVLVTGIGLVTSVGDPPGIAKFGGREATWSGIREGRSGAAWLNVGTQGERPHAGFPISEFDRDPSTVVNIAAEQAAGDAKLFGNADLDRDRAAVLVGVSKGDVRRLSRLHSHLLNVSDPPPWIWNFFWRSRPDVASRNLSLRFDFRGASLAPIAACATGVVAAWQGAELIRRGLCDIAMVGAGDSSMVPLVLGAFRNMKALARVDDDPRRAIRPWDKTRSGFLPGEGAAILVLEREEHAIARGILPYAEFAGGAIGSDAYHMTDLNPDPAGLAYLIQLALKNADVQPSEIDHINVHGTATRQNDPLECQAIRRAFGSQADSISCSANKPQIGHLLGAAGAAELAITCLAMRDGFVPPTLNLDDPDPRCDLDGTPHVGKSRNIRAALKLSIGFGGHLAAAVLKQYNGPRRPPVPRPPTPDPHV